MSDQMTAERRISHYAKILVEIDLSGKLFDSIEINLSNCESLSQKVIYEKMPSFCRVRMQIGHSANKHSSENHTVTKHSTTLIHVSVAPKQSAKNRNVHENRITAP